MNFSFDGEIFTVERLKLKPLPVRRPLVSVIISTYRRPEQLAKTLASINRQHYPNLEGIVVQDGNDADKTREIVEQNSFHYIRRRNRPQIGFSNPAVPINIGIQQSHGDVLIIQCSECRYDGGPSSIEKLVMPVIEDPAIANYATVRELDRQGNPVRWLNHPDTHPNCYLNYCVAVDRRAVESIGGFDEGFKGWGFDDNLFSFMLQYSGADCRYAQDVLVSHQWHEPCERDGVSHADAAAYYAERIDSIKRGMRNVANAGKRWGDLNS